MVNSPRTCVICRSDKTYLSNGSEHWHKTDGGVLCKKCYNREIRLMGRRDRYFPMFNGKVVRPSVKKYKPINCCDCGVICERKSPFAKRCIDCRRHVKSSYHKRYRKGERWQRWSKKFYDKNRKAILYKSFIRVCRLKEQLFHILGQHSCVNCGYYNKMALLFDHIKNGGSKERKELGLRGSTSFYYYVNRPDYARERLQVLCYNCNEIKRKQIYHPC